MDMHALQGDGKAISAEHATVQFDDADDDAMQLQKAAAVLFGFSGLTEMKHGRCTMAYHRLLDPCNNIRACQCVDITSPYRWHINVCWSLQVRAPCHMWRCACCFQTWYP
jgi:hypothetical protein